MENDRLTTDDIAAGTTPEDDLDTRAADAGAYDDDTDGDRRELLESGDTQGFRSRWEQIQVGFVDEPRQSVEQADALVAELMQRLAETFSQERQKLEAQWDGGDDASTEDLRVALQRYRSFFDRLLSA